MIEPRSLALLIRTNLAPAEDDGLQFEVCALPDLPGEDLHLEGEEAVALEADVRRPQHHGYQLVEGVLVQVAAGHLQPAESPDGRSRSVKHSRR